MGPMRINSSRLMLSPMVGLSLQGTSGSFGLVVSVATGAVMLSQMPARAKALKPSPRSPTQAITVRIEGATHGSGELVKRDGNR